MAVLELNTLTPIKEKVLAGERLDFDDGVALMETDDLLALGDLADLARRQRGGGDEVFFVQNLYLNQTNVCRVKCKFCAFAATQKQAHAYTLTPDEFVAEAVAQRELHPYTEIHLVNRLNHEHPDKTVVTLDPLVCPCSTMSRIDLPHLAWVLERLVEDRVVNQIVVEEQTAEWAKVALERMLSIT